MRCVILPVDDLEFCGSGGETGARHKSSEDDEQWAERRHVLRRLWEPDIDTGEGKVEIRRQDADDGVRESSDVDCATDNLRIGSVSSLPQARTDDYNRRTTGLVFFCSKAASDERLNA